MSGAFDFAPKHHVPILVPPEPTKAMSMNGWSFTAKPTTPYQRKFKVMLHGMKWLLYSSGLFDAASEPSINARRLELFYEANQCWDTFTYNHPHLGALTCRFDQPVQIPAAIPNSDGLIEPFEIVLIEHNPAYSTPTVPPGETGGGPAVTLNALTLSPATIYELTSNGTVVGTVGARTATSTLAIVSDQTGGAFAINASTGQITVADGTKLDFEIMPNPQIIVAEVLIGATNSGRQTTFTIPITNVVNPSFSGAPSISGSSVQGSTLTGNDGSYANGSVAAREWLRDGTVVASGETYTTQPADLGKNITFRVTLSNSIGEVASATSTGVVITSPVAGTAGEPIGLLLSLTKAS